MSKAEPPKAASSTKGVGSGSREFTDIKRKERSPFSAALVIAIGCTLALSALLLSPGVFFFYDVTPKIVVLLLGCAAVVAGGPQWIPHLRVVRSHTAGRILLAAMALQAASVVASTLLSSDRGLSHLGSSWRRLGLLEELSLLVIAAALASFAAGSQHRVLILLRTISLAGAIGALGRLDFQARLARLLGDGRA